MSDRDHIEPAEKASTGNGAEADRKRHETTRDGTTDRTRNDSSGGDDAGGDGSGDDTAGGDSALNDDTHRTKTAGKRSDDASDKRQEEGGRFKRLTGETRGLVDDLKEWVDLKIQLIQLDFEDRVRLAANQAALTAVVLVVALLALLFGLIAGAEALGAWFDSRPLGFLALAGILALVAAVIHLAKPRLIEQAATDEDVKAKPDLLPDRSKDVPALPEADTDAAREHSNQSQSSDDHR